MAKSTNIVLDNRLHSIHQENSEKAEYIKSYVQAASDEDILSIAEEGDE